MANRIEKAIKSLLFEHDYVMIPGFGAFIVNYVPAEYSNENKSFTPPVRNISFNAMLKQDDGLIITYLSRNFSMPIDEARKVILDFTSRLKNQLAVQKMVTIEGVGVFSLNKENTIVFEPFNQLNYFSESFGFEKFYTSKSLQKPSGEVVMPIDVVGISSIDEIEILPIQKKKSSFLTKLLYASPVIALGAGLVFLVLLSPNTEKEAKSSVNPIEHLQSFTKRFENAEPENISVKSVPVVQELPPVNVLVINEFKDKEEAVRNYNELVLNDLNPTFIENQDNYKITIQVDDSNQATISSKIKQLIKKSVVLEKN